MTNTKALEVAQQIEHSCFDEGGYDPYKATVLIQAAIDEATQAERTMCDRLAEALKMLGTWRLAIELTDAGQYIGGIFHAFNNADTALNAYTTHKEGR